GLPGRLHDLPRHARPVRSQHRRRAPLRDPHLVRGDFTPDVISALAGAGPALTSPLSIVSIRHCHGAAERVPLDATAFGIRRRHFTLEIVAAWEPDDADSARHRAWADSVSAALAPCALPGGCPGLLGPGDPDQIARAYGQNAPRLRVAKARFDPDGVFSA